jgi:hypothetical protein
MMPVKVAYSFPFIVAIKKSFMEKHLKKHPAIKRPGVNPKYYHK